jgi:hypothetical protein
MNICGGVLSLRRTETRARRAFSLVIVLMIAVAGMSLLGGLLYMFDTFAGASRTVANDTEVYNHLQSEVENAKSFLRSYMYDKKKKVQAKVGKGDMVKSLADIEVWKKNDDGTLDSYLYREKRDREKVGMREGRLTVRIYDMQHEGKIPKSPGDAGLTDAQYEELIASLPPTMPFSGKAEADPPAGPEDVDEPSETKPDTASPGVAEHCGVYLIRASIDFGEGMRKTIETALVQRDGSPESN